ncbi:hypothetical protein [Pontibacter ramchanderi]|uniref:Uncharacterized protein n=1 Tax=Pontibacter ramchanderi TaxID=1179743 RepID=A0A2N3V2N4_9BACT|nr:hypothetical protein [Pontibacter ramchanderi]PKV75880.1 hypothetical protein BD749_0828 [Pontibacter ramchanderi]
MEADDKVVLNYFHRKIKERIRQLVKAETQSAEHNAKHLVGGLGLEAELRFFEDLLDRKMERARLDSGGFHVPVPFTRKELQQKEFDTPAIIANRREVYESLYQERKDEFIDQVAKGYCDLDVYQYLKNRIIGIRAAITLAGSGPGKAKEKTSLVWLAKHRHRLERLHASLIEENIIEEIDLDIFCEHFAGIPQSVYINFLPPKALVFYLLDRLKPYLSAELYTAANSTSSPTVVARHFVFKGKLLKDPYSVKSKGVSDKYWLHKKRINQIASSLAVL